LRKATLVLTADRSAESATVAITTRNRRDSARAAIASALAQEPQSPVIVVDDASSDGTAEMVRAEFPQARLVRFDAQAGYIAGRMCVLELATTPIVCFLDDDATFSTPAVVRGTVADFDHPRIAGVAIPLMENGRLLQGAPGSTGFRVTDYFIGAAHAVRRESVLALGGYRTSYSFYVEEPDLCIRLLQAGMVTRVGRSDPVIHLPHPARVHDERFTLRIKNELLFKWYHTPSIYLPAVLAGHMISSAREAVRRKFARAFLQAMTQGLAELVADRAARRQVDLRVYRTWRLLRKERSVAFERIAPSLSPLEQVSQAQGRTTAAPDQADCRDS
jgi:GT2 family glycosyltransferase